MADFVLSIPDAEVATVIDCLCAAGGYPDVSIANGKKAVIDWITATVNNVQTTRAQPPPVTIPKIGGLT